MTCRLCRGNEYIETSHGPVLCPTCDGSGVVRCNVQQGQHGIPHDCPESAARTVFRVRSRDLPAWTITDEERAALG